MAKALLIDIIIVIDDNNIITTEFINCTGGEVKNDTHTLILHKKGNHYNAIVPINEDEKNAKTHNTKQGESLKSIYYDLKCALNHMSSLSIGMLNVRSLLHKIGEIRLLLLIAQFDIFCINETWLDESVLYSELEVIGYSASSKHRNRHGGGILIYVNDKLDCIRRCDLEIIDLECVWIEIRTETGKMLISSIYRPTSANEKYIDTILDSIERAHDENCIILVVGDLNIDCGKPNTQLYGVPFSHLIQQRF